MNRTDIETVANLIIDEEFEKANILIHKILNEETTKLYTQHLIESGDLKVNDDEDENDKEKEDISEDLDDDTMNDDDSEAGKEIVNTDSEEVSSDDNIEPGEDAAEINATFNDITRDFASLKAKFNEIMGINSEENEDDSDNTEVDEDVYDDDISGGNDDASPLTLANEDEDLSTDDNIFNDDLAESLDLSTVNVDMKSPKEAGTGKSVKVDNKSFVSTKEGDKGTPIEIKSSGEPKGTGLEKSPEVKPSSIKSTNVMDLKPVSKEGDKSAKLNSKQGFGSDNDDSPLSKINK